MPIRRRAQTITEHNTDEIDKLEHRRQLRHQANQQYYAKRKATRLQVNPILSTIDNNHSENPVTAGRATPTTSRATATASGTTPTASGATPTASGAIPTASRATPTASGATPTTSGATPTASGATPTAIPTASALHLDNLLLITLFRELPNSANILQPLENQGQKHP
ncbi:hypothetical protein L211DRAFT_851112 [Terfezia boudieri ATCC MYA-4762]|uniref:Uncharacterized protein n=1 Tax=Terfezia boudieri ATCC MYA-4762 TaxID=1051890 RepID=A0A3N4LG84_9PEZI|nr:hypothetical protein L211DRAFT_851112 [Terfezia boudieri ATCC MYA-4762]